MDRLEDRKCRPCEGGVAPLDAAAAREYLGNLHADWVLDEKSRSISRQFKLKTFSRNIAFVNAVAFVATTEGHHPEVTFSYADCRVSFRTTAIDGLSENDFICAAKVDRLAEAL